MPRANDPIRNMLNMMAEILDEETILQMAFDIEDAFWNLPNHPQERRFFVTKLGRKFIIILRTAQGSRNAMLTWSTVVSIAGRMVQSTFTDPSYRRRRSTSGIAMEIYVDDPHVTMRGTPDRIKFNTVKLLAIWMALGFPIAFKKIAHGPAINWIGSRFTAACDERLVRVEVPQDKVMELIAITKEISSKNVIAHRQLKGRFLGVIVEVHMLELSCRRL